LKSFGSFSATSFGTGRLDALPASSPNVASRLLGACETTPRSTVRLAGVTFHSAAAAATSMARAVAPALRNCIHELAIAELPPVPCIVPNIRLAYLLASAGADSTRI
jgi:hypothetical protein